MNRMYKVLFILSLIVLGIESKTIYVSPTGNDSPGGGSLSSPFRSVSYAASQSAVAGDFIQVKFYFYFFNL